MLQPVAQTYSFHTDDRPVKTTVSVEISVSEGFLRTPSSLGKGGRATSTRMGWTSCPVILRRFFNACKNAGFHVRHRTKYAVMHEVEFLDNRL